MILDFIMLSNLIKEAYNEKIILQRYTQYSFRSGEWAEVLGTTFKERLCFLIQYSDGTLDYTPVIDIENYELKEEQDEN